MNFSLQGMKRLHEYTLQPGYFIFSTSGQHMNNGSSTGTMNEQWMLSHQHHSAGIGIPFLAHQRSSWGEPEQAPLSEQNTENLVSAMDLQPALDFAHE